MLAKEMPWAAAAWEERASQGAVSDTLATFVAVEDDDCVAIVDAVAIDAQTVDIAGMWVSPAHRRRGVGRALVEAVGDWARSRGAEALGLWVVANNTPAVALYVATGFRRIGKALPVPTAPHTLQIRMVRDLAAAAADMRGGGSQALTDDHP